MDPLATRRSRSTLLALAAVALAAWSIAGYAQDDFLRRPAEGFARRFSLDRRRPLEVAAMRLERSPDGAAAVAVDAALEDVREPAPPADIGPELRALWLESAKDAGEELAGARDLELAAMSRRPGRAQHRFLLGQVVFAQQSRAGSGDDPARWIAPLVLAGSAAPGLDPIFTFLGDASLASWARLSPEQRRDVASQIQRAMMDSGFVARSLLRAGSALGRDEALGLVPDQAPTLRAASDALAHDGDLARVAALRPRLDKALRAERDLGIARISERLAAGDLEGARSACQEWIARSPAAEFDDPSGRAQAARVLELWPNDTGGAWRTDPRGELVRYFLNHREKDVRADALVRATDALSAVPETVRARVRLLAGEAAEAEDIRQKSGTPNSYEWTPYLLDVARAKLALGDAAGARAVLKGLSPTAADGCDVLLLRRDVAASLGDEAETAIVEDRLRWLRRDNVPAEAWSAGGAMTVCLDGKGDRRLRVSIDAAGPAIVAYGWNGGREGSVLVPKGPSVLTLPLPALQGRQIFSVTGETGGRVVPGAVTFVPKA